MRTFLLACLLVFLCSLAPALADIPPKSLTDHVSSKELVFYKKCNFRGEKNVECLIFYEEKNDIVWLVLFDDDLAITRVVAVKNKVASILWCRQDVCV